MKERLLIRARREQVNHAFFFEDLRLLGDAISARQRAHSRCERKERERMEDVAVEIGFDLLERLVASPTQNDYELVERHIRRVELIK